MSPLTPTQVGIAIGAVLVIVWAAFGFGWLVLVAVGMIVGAVVGRVVEGKLDVTSLADVVTGKRRSS